MSAVGVQVFVPLLIVTVIVTFLLSAGLSVTRCAYPDRAKKPVLRGDERHHLPAVTRPFVGLSGRSGRQDGEELLLVIKAAGEIDRGDRSLLTGARRSVERHLYGVRR